MILYAMNYLISTLIITISAIGVGISQGLTNRAAFKAIDIQPQSRDAVTKISLLCSALIETAAILCVFVAVLLFLDTTPPLEGSYGDMSKIGIIFALATTGFSVSFFSSWPAQEACLATARQPFIAPWIFNLTLIMLSVIQTPLILAFIVALSIKSQAVSALSIADGLRLIGAGFAIGIGSIGPTIGLAHFARTSLQSIAANRNAAGRILTFTFISQAIIESPIIFAMVTALILLFYPITLITGTIGLPLLAAGIAAGVGNFGPGISSGRTAAAACKQISINPNAYSSLANTSIFAQGVIDTAAIYVLLISVLIIFFT